MRDVWVCGMCVGCVRCVLVWAWVWVVGLCVGVRDVWVCGMCVGCGPVCGQYLLPLMYLPQQALVMYLPHLL